uniref:Uncharacterized protein n=1 Tax=Fusarium oxysporum (strain Fo5176) TaxID=660025 RepID=A0A0D2XFK4_FUSOF
MNFLRNRLPAPKQDLLAKQARQQGTTDAAYKPSRISELSNESPSWYKSAARRHLYFLLFPACVVSYATSGYDGTSVPRPLRLLLLNSVGEMASWLPIPGPVPIFAARFVDPALGFALAWNYWYQFAIGVPIEVTVSAVIVNYWHHNIPQVALISLSATLVSGQTTWKSMVSTKGNRYRMFLVICMGLMSQWSGNGLISYYLSRVMDTVGITNKKTQALVNGLINIWNWALALTSACFVDRVGRRPLFRISTVGMLLVFTGWTIASERFAATEAKSAGVAVMALIFVYEIFYCMAFSPLPVAYSVEVLPYSIRAKGMGVYVLATKCAVFVTQYVNPVGLDSIGWRYYLVYVAVLIVESFIAYGWSLETKGKALEEIAVIFDGEAADVTVDEPAKSKVFNTDIPTTLEQENVDRKV